jgi:hypothetical protein
VPHWARQSSTDAASLHEAELPKQGGGCRELILGEREHDVEDT